MMTAALVSSYLLFQAMSSLKRLEDKVRTIEDDIDSVNDWLLEDEFGMIALGSSTCTDSVLASPEQQTAGTSKLLATGNPPDPKSTSPSNRNETKVPSELIAHCVATLLMIQVRINNKCCMIFSHSTLLQNSFLFVIIES